MVPLMVLRNAATTQNIRRKKREKERERKAVTVFRPWSSPVAAAIKRPVVTMMYPPQVAVARAAPEIHGNREMSVYRESMHVREGEREKERENRRIRISESCVTRVPMLPHVTLFSSDHSLLRFLK